MQPILSQSDSIFDNLDQHNLFASSCQCVCPSCSTGVSNNDETFQNLVTNGTSSETPESTTTTPPINAVLSGRKWSVAPGGNLTYSFYEDTVFNGAYYGSQTGVKEVSNAVKNNMRSIIDWVETIINVNFNEVTETNTSTFGQIRVMNSNGPSYAYAYYPSTSSLGGDIHLNPTYDRFGDTNGFQHQAGRHGYMSLVHELGHALGLAHTHDGTVLNSSLDNTDNSVMTYKFTGSSAGTFMPLDILALQTLYGAKANNSGDTVYQFTDYIDNFTVNGNLSLNTTYRTKQSIWDSGGYDTLDFSNLRFESSGYHIDLNPGGMLSRTFNGVTSYSTAIAYNVDIEEVINSSSNDKIYLNDVANIVSGYNANRITGNDVIFDGTSADTLQLDYGINEVTQTQSGQDLVLGLGGNGSVRLKDYYVDLNNQINITYSDTTLLSQPTTIAEYGQVSVDHNELTINLSHDFINPVVFALTPSFNGSHFGNIRVSNIQNGATDSFTLKFQEGNYLDGSHALETVSYMVLEAGTWQLEDGTMLTVGTVNGNTNSWNSVNLNNVFTNAPAVFTQVQTNNDVDFVTTRQRATTANGFELRLQEEEANKTGNSGETVGYFALQTGTGTWNDNPYQVGVTDDVVTHQQFGLNFASNQFSQTPNLFASIATTDGVDPSVLRSSNLTQTGVNLTLQEEQSFDQEINHTTEQLSYFAIGGSGILTGNQTDPLSSQTAAIFPSTAEVV